MDLRFLSCCPYYWEEEEEEKRDLSAGLVPAETPAGRSVEVGGAQPILALEEASPLLQEVFAGYLERGLCVKTLQRGRRHKPFTWTFSSSLLPGSFPPVHIELIQEYIEKSRILHHLSKTH